jgi:hypothetical protein
MERATKIMQLVIFMLLVSSTSLQHVPLTLGAAAVPQAVLVSAHRPLLRIDQAARFVWCLLFVQIYGLRTDNKLV